MGPLIFAFSHGGVWVVGYDGIYINHGMAKLSNRSPGMDEIRFISYRYLVVYMIL